MFIIRQLLVHRFFYLNLVGLVLLTACVNVSESPSITSTNSSQSEFAVATAHPLATQAGIKILQQGGNAFDAAVAVTAVLAVVEPYASGLGGGGFWLLHLADEQRDVMIDGREVAPLAATRNMYIGVDGKPTGLSVNGPLAAGIPGTPAAIVHIAEKYGRLTLAQNLQAAIHLAQDGFVLSDFYIKRAKAVLQRLQSFPATAKIFLANNKIPQAGDRLQQKDLARVLEQIAAYGEEGFYGGKVAQQLVASVQQAGGIWQLEDLENYQIVERQPITGKYKNLEIISAALPSSGGIVLMQVLNILSQFDLHTLDDVQRKHIIIEAMRRAYHDRAQYLGDQDFVDVQVETLLSKQYAENRWADFSVSHATPSKNILQENIGRSSVLNEQAQNTTHFSILDQYGNRVAATVSINYYFGSGFVAQGTGVLLNNEMDDFAIQPGHANLWGLVGSEANAIEPGKRMLSSMSPTFLKDGNRIAILGTPGGSRIISMVLLSTLAFVEGASAEQMVNLPRYHHQFLPDEVQFETGALTTNTVSTLQSMGHLMKDLERTYGNMHAIVRDVKTKITTAASDARGIGMAQVGTIQ